jgi:D-tyrosyl-tRNA(Tyr) deacylase
MKAVVQRVLSSTVTVGGEMVGGTLNPQTGNTHGLLIFLGVALGDTKKDSSYLANKVAHLRIFEDAERKMNKSVLDVEGSALVVSQFTLLADWQKGRRPGFSKAAPPKEAGELYLHFAEELRMQGLAVETGQFAASMNVSLTNYGPVTLILDSKEVAGAPEPGATD